MIHWMMIWINVNMVPAMMVMARTNSNWYFGVGLGLYTTHLAIQRVVK